MPFDEVEFEETESGELRKPTRKSEMDGAKGSGASRKPRAPRSKGPPRLSNNPNAIDLGPGFEERASDRPLQLASYIRREVQLMLSAGLSDPRVQGMISITEVLMTPDLLEARISVSVMPQDRERLTLSGLRSAAGHLRLRLLHEGRLGRIPQLVFEVDDRLKKGAALEAVLRATTADAASRATPDELLTLHDAEDAHASSDDAEDKGAGSPRPS